MKDTIEYVFDKANDYERIKEKLIGETFEYAPEFTYIINGLLMRYERYPELIRFLRQNSNLITSTFNKSGTRNLRILKHALNDFKKIFDMVSRDYSNTNNRIMQTMLIFTIAISFEIKAGKVEYRLDKSNIIHVAIGKVSFGGEKLAENFAALMDAIVKAKPAAAKGQYLRSVTVASTMGPGVKINPAKIAE